MLKAIMKKQLVKNENAHVYYIQQNQKVNIFKIYLPKHNQMELILNYK